MSNHTTALKELLCKLLPPGHVFQPVIDAEKQNAELDRLDEDVLYERFYFVFDMQDCRFTHINGVGKWLGYPDKQFSVAKYLSIIHPGQAIQFNMLAHTMYQLLCTGTFKMQFSTQRYISMLGLKHYNGEYILFRKTTSVFQYDAQNRLLAQLNVFDRIDAYEGSPLKPKITDLNTLQKDDFERMVFTMVMKNFMNKKFFSNKEFQVLTLYASHPFMKVSDLALQLKISAATVSTYNARILKKAKDIFTHPFTEAKDVAIYLRKERVL